MLDLDPGLPLLPGSRRCLHPCHPPLDLHRIPGSRTVLTAPRVLKRPPGNPELGQRMLLLLQQQGIQ